MRCAALHRKLGTHITKVKSLSMDSWTNEQVEVRSILVWFWTITKICQNMKRVGNVASNRVYNPANTRAPIPFDADEVDSAMERFIRGKYVERAAPHPPARNNTGSTNSDDQPPPLPPKSGSRFGFRSASSIFPLSSNARRESATKQNFENHAQQRSPSPPRNKQSKIFGTAVGAVEADDLDMKLQKLRDMGFRDERRNTAVLKGLNGNLEKSIETLVRLGEGGSGGLKSPEIAGPPANSRSRTPVEASSGLTINRTRDLPSPNSYNPFDMLDTPPPLPHPQSSQSTGGLASPLGNNPFQQAQNSHSFGIAPSHSQHNLNQAFQNMSVQSSQPLFPNRTGGFPAPQPAVPQQIHQQSMTPPMPPIPQQYHQPVTYGNSTQQPHHPQTQQNSYNPFMQQNPPTQAPSSNTNFASNPYNQQTATFQSPTIPSPAQQYGAAFFGNGGQVQQQSQMNPFLGQNASQQMNPFLNQQQSQLPQANYSQLYQQQGQQIHPQVPQQPVRADTRSIMDLYNYPQMAPTPSSAFIQPGQSQIQAQPQPGSQATESQPSASVPPSAGTNNPFAMSGGGANPSSEDTLGQMGQFAPKQNVHRNVSRESVDASGWANGRHSPDAWGSISARSTR